MKKIVIASLLLTSIAYAGPRTKKNLFVEKYKAKALQIKGKEIECEMVPGESDSGHFSFGVGATKINSMRINCNDGSSVFTKSRAGLSVGAFSVALEQGIAFKFSNLTDIKQLEGKYRGLGFDISYPFTWWHLAWPVGFQAVHVVKSDLVRMSFVGPVRSIVNLGLSYREYNIEFEKKYVSNHDLNKGEASPKILTAPIKDKTAINGIKSAELSFENLDLRVIFPNRDLLLDKINEAKIGEKSPKVIVNVYRYKKYTHLINGKMIRIRLRPSKISTSSNLLFEDLIDDKNGFLIKTDLRGSENNKYLIEFNIKLSNGMTKKIEKTIDL